MSVLVADAWTHAAKGSFVFIPGGVTHDAATDADARLCLEFPTNLQVIMCAEKYRPHKRNA